MGRLLNTDLFLKIGRRLDSSKKLSMLKNCENYLEYELIRVFQIYLNI